MSSTLEELPVSAAVARVAAGLLEAARAAWPRVPDPSDPEGLHDFRVALRRLHSCLRAYRGHECPVPKKVLRAVRALARATNEARDLEVLLGWVDRELPHVPDECRGAAADWRNQVAAQAADAQHAAVEYIERSFPALDARVGRRIERLEKRGTAGGRFGDRTAERIERLGDCLERQLGAIGGPDDRKRIHAARITGKRLRYLLTPIKGENGACGEAERLAKSFQDTFGELHDCHVRFGVLGDAVAAAGREEALARFRHIAAGEGTAPADSGRLDGLLALAGRNRATMQTLWAEAERRYRGGRECDLFQAIADAVRRLREGHPAVT